MIQFLSQRGTLTLLFICSVVSIFAEVILWSIFFTPIPQQIPYPSFITTTGTLSLDRFITFSNY